MTRAQDTEAARKDFEVRVAELLGRPLTGVAYWDVHTFADGPRTWDHDDWHHASMGVELLTPAGPRTITWADTFFPYGVEVFAEPMEQHLALGPDGPEGWTVEDHPLWRARAGQPVRSARTFWERIEVGPARLPDGTVVSPAEHLEVPVGLRLDFDAGPVWFVAGVPQYPGMDRFFVPGDEILVVFSSARMRSIGFPADEID